MSRKRIEACKQRKERRGVFTVFLLALMAASINANAVELPDLPKLIEQNGKAVVNIRVEQNGLSKTTMTQPGIPGAQELPEPLRRFFHDMPNHSAPSEPHMVGIGSGFIISPDGYIVTNTHVIDGADEVKVIMKDRREFVGKVVGRDDRSDVALLKIDAKNLPVIKTGDSDKLKVGQWVFAIGAPFGFDQTATQGIVSALSRSLPDGTYVPFIQTDVAVNPGNSGGPLFDLNGNVVGVNSQIYSRSGGYMGLSFAIPINLVKNVTAQLQSKGYVSRGWLGVGIQGMDDSLAHSFKLDRATGALVSEVDDNGPAKKAGIEAGDIILSVNGKTINRANDLPVLIGMTPAGSEVSVKVLRNGKEKTLEVTIGELDHKQPKKVAANAAGKGKLGVAVSELDPEARQKLGLKNKGILIQGVIPGSPASKAGLREGDVLLSFNNKTIAHPEDLKNAAKKAPVNEPLAVLIIREAHPQFLSLEIDDKVS